MRVDTGKGLLLLLRRLPEGRREERRGGGGKGLDAGRDGMIVSAQVGIRPLSASSCFKLLLLRTYLTTRSHSILRSRDLMHICIPYGVLRLHLSSVFPIPSQPLCRPISLSSKFPPPGLISSCRASIPPVDHDASSHLCLTFFFSRRPTVLGKPTEGSMGRPPLRIHNQRSRPSHWLRLQDPVEAPGSPPGKSTPNGQ